MSNDSVLALAVLGVLLVVLTYKQFSTGLLDLMMVSTSGSTAVLLLVVLGLFYKNYFYTALALSVLSVFLLKDLRGKYVSSDARRLNGEIERDLARFDANKSVDIQWGNGTAKHDAPNPQVKPVSVDKLLIFPPSKEVLQSMCG
jgi:uncharacterized membrane protein